MAIKTATGIERFQNEKGYGLTCCSHLSKQANQTLARCDISEEEEVAKTFEDFVPTKKLKLPKKNKMTEDIDLLKQVVEKGPAKQLISFMKDEAEKLWKHDCS